MLFSHFFSSPTLEFSPFLQFYLAGRKVGKYGSVKSSLSCRLQEVFYDNARCNGAAWQAALLVLHIKSHRATNLNEKKGCTFL